MGSNLNPVWDTVIFHLILILRIASHHLQKGLKANVLFDSHPANEKRERKYAKYLWFQSSQANLWKDSDFKQYWMPDSNCKECYECGDRFNTFRRRHHCRICGQIFCSRCCNQEVPGKIMGYIGQYILVNLGQSSINAGQRSVSLNVHWI